MMKSFFLRTFCACVVTLALVPLVSAQADRAQSKIDIVQRYDLQRTIDGKYVGLFYGYTKSTWFLMFPFPDGSYPVEARWYMTEESINDLGRNEKQLSDEMYANFRWYPDGSISMNSRSPAPFVRGFPAPPPLGALPGHYWDAPGTLTVDPDGSGKWTTLKMYARYTMQGRAQYGGRETIAVHAKYAIRYKEIDDPQGNPALKTAEGSREATIYLNPETMFPIFIRERVMNEIWTYKDGRKIKNNGFILWFFEGGIFQQGSAKIAGVPRDGPVLAQTSVTTIAAIAAVTATTVSSSSATTVSPSAVTAITTTTTASAVASAATTTTVPIAVASVVPTTSTTIAQSIAALMRAQTEKIRQDLEDQKIEGVDVRPDPRGTAITLENLRFVADSAELLPGENARLDKIATLLKKVAGEKSFLIRGHSAKAGSEAGQLSLSKDRAKRILAALVQRGFAAGRFYWEGKGSTEPIADNATEEGKSKNRRVEIIILE